MKKRLGLPVVLCFVAALSVGCSHKDATTDAAPPPAADAHALPNMAASKHMPALGLSKGGSPAAGGMRQAGTKPPGAGNF